MEQTTSCRVLKNMAKSDLYRAQTPAFPTKMLILTAFSLAVIVVAFLRISDVEDWLGHGTDVIMVASLFYGIVLLVLWVGWFLLLSRWKWSWRVIASSLLISVPFLFLKIFRPVNGGDATIVRLEPIWNRRPDIAPIQLPAESSDVDLKTETDADFPRFLGSGQDAVIRNGTLIESATFAQSEISWKQPIGRGWSGFVARNGFAVTMEQRQEQECVTCYDIATGELKWVYQHRARHLDQMNLGRIGPRSTPTIHDGMVYAVGAVGNFVCLNGADGSVVWQVDLNTLLQIEILTETDSDGVLIQSEKDSALSWGRSGSPLIVGDMVIIPGGGPLSGPQVTLLAFDRLSGEVRWKAGEEMIAYGSPTLAKVAGIEQILIVAETKAMGFDATTGQPLWNFPRPGESNGGANTSQLTVVNPNQVLTSKGYPDGGGELIALSSEGGTVVPHSVWNNSRVLKTKLMSPRTLRRSCVLPFEWFPGMRTTVGGCPRLETSRAFRSRPVAADRKPNSAA